MNHCCVLTISEKDLKKSYSCLKMWTQCLHTWTHCLWNVLYIILIISLSSVVFIGRCGIREAAPQTRVVIPAAHTWEAEPGTEPKTLNKAFNLQSAWTCQLIHSLGSISPKTKQLSYFFFLFPLTGTGEHQSRPRSSQRRPVVRAARRLPGFSQKLACKSV